MGNLAVLETKKLMRKPSIYLGVILASLFSCAIAYVAFLNPESFGKRNVYAFFADIAQYVLIVFAAKSLGDEFQFKTSAILFTNRYSRMEILFSKIVSLLGLGLLMGLVSGMIGVIFLGVMGELTALHAVLELTGVIGRYLVYTFCVGSFVLLWTVLSSHTIASLFSAIGFFFLLPAVIGMAVSKFSGLVRAVEYIPFYSASNVIHQPAWNQAEVTGLILSGMIFAALAVYFLNRKDLT
ncbi:ABC transporter permease [Bacillus sp. SJS]|uniref:ABC transporter permease n=1 Tax=Bacillus sp. SJS TaxID=1423321 RepID=UPI0004DD8FF4|nr:ABC transporter permease [Bacillus sp. SJS]KZZ84921.1 hypothetical protein AS29_007655 [Bacillus sp. SJS]